MYIYIFIFIYWTWLFWATCLNKMVMQYTWQTSHNYSKSTIKIPCIKTIMNCLQPSWHAFSSKMGGWVLERFGKKSVAEGQKILSLKLGGCCVMRWWSFSGEESEFWWKWKTAWLQLKKHDYLICYSNMLKMGQYARS